jgi:hypothetical protein
MTFLAPYLKAVTALVGVVLTWGGTAYVPDGHVSRPEFYALAIALATVLGVFAVPNTPTTWVPSNVGLTPPPPQGQVHIVTGEGTSHDPAAG